MVGSIRTRHTKMHGNFATDSQLAQCTNLAPATRVASC